MKTAKEFRKIALDSLSNKWSSAVLVGLLASLLCGVNDDGLSFNINYKKTVNSENLDEYIGSVFNITDMALIHNILIIVFFALLALLAVYSLFGSIIEVGYSEFNLKLIDREDADLNILFNHFKNWSTIICASLLKFVYIALGFFLLIIPGILATYSYRMTSYILAEHPELSSSDALEMSKNMMNGNRFRFFCLQLSFIGWEILCVFTFGIGNLWLSPYKQAAYSAFYREISCTEKFVYN